MIRDTKLHRWRYAQRLMDAAEILVRDVQHDGGHMVLEFFREGVCPPREAAARIRWVGYGENYNKCLLGMVSERCGGNPVA